MHSKRQSARSKASYLSSYAESMHAFVQMLAAGWNALGMVNRGEFVGVIGFASVDWFVSDVATTYMGGIMSPLPTNILVEDIQCLILEAEVRLCQVSETRLRRCSRAHFWHPTWLLCGSM